MTEVEIASALELPTTRPARETIALDGSLGLAACIIAGVYIAVIAAVAGLTGAYYVMFPELGALAYDVLTRPRGRWASAPIHLATTPAIAGVIGIFVCRHLAYGFVSVILTVAGAMGVIIALGSPIGPAISAGFLPLVLGVASWWYPPGVMFGSTLLVAVSALWKRYLRIAAPEAIETTEDHRDRTTWDGVGPVLIFVLFGVLIVQITGLRFVLFPPLVVIGYEMFRHPGAHAWAGRIWRMPLACTLSALCGYCAYLVFGASIAGAASAVTAGVVVIAMVDVHVPPALAVALLPMVMDHPRATYPLAVAIGTLALVVVFAMGSRLTGRGACPTNARDENGYC